MLPVIILVAIATLIVCVHRKYMIIQCARARFPPGPGTLLKLPLLGHLHLLSKSVPQTFFEWSQNYYGDIFSVQLGQYNTVVINDYKLIKEILNDTRVNGRPDLASFDAISGGKKGILNGVHESWMELRKFSLQNMRDISMGEKSMDNLMHVEITELLDSLAKLGVNGQPVSLKNSLNLLVLNILWTVFVGQRLEKDDPTLVHLMQKINAVTKTSENAAINFMPKLAKRFASNSGWNSMIFSLDSLRNFQKQLVKEHKETLDCDYPRDLIDVFLIEMKKCKDTKSCFDGDDAENQLIALLNDLMLGGTGPTSAAMLWAVLFLATNTEVQRELQIEIDSVIGRSCLPTMAARPKMPYAIAVLMETLRKSSVFPLGVFHATTENIEFHGFQFPKDTPICTNLWAAHHDPRVWGDPENFRPERFLSTTSVNVSENDAKTTSSTPRRKLERHEASLPFSFGKRTCLGELLAKEQLFLFITGFFQRFHIQLGEIEMGSNSNLNREGEGEDGAGNKFLPLSNLLNILQGRTPTVTGISWPPRFTVVIQERT